MRLLRLIPPRPWYQKVLAAWATLFIAVPVATAFWIGADFWIVYLWLLTTKPFFGVPLILALMVLAPLWLLPFATIVLIQENAPD